MVVRRTIPLGWLPALIALVACDSGSTAPSDVNPAWVQVRHHVLTHYPVSNTYFGRHLVFESAIEPVDVLSNQRPDGTRDVILSACTAVNYTFRATSPDGRKHQIIPFWQIILYRGAPLEEASVPPELIERYPEVVHSFYSRRGVTREIDLKLSARDAVALIRATNLPEFVAFSWDLVTEEQMTAEIAPKLLSGYLEWWWEAQTTDGKLLRCRVNEDNREVSFGLRG